jgi:hypothetical protein
MRKNKKAAFREAEWEALGKANAKGIIYNYPDGVTKPTRQSLDGFFVF